MTTRRQPQLGDDPEFGWSCTGLASQCHQSLDQQGRSRWTVVNSDHVHHQIGSIGTTVGQEWPDIDGLAASPIRHGIRGAPQQGTERVSSGPRLAANFQAVAHHGARRWRGPLAHVHEANGLG
jgi:hypothetical protein